MNISRKHQPLIALNLLRLQNSQKSHLGAKHLLISSLRENLSSVGNGPGVARGNVEIPTTQRSSRPSCRASQHLPRLLPGCITVTPPCPTPIKSQGPLPTQSPLAQVTEEAHQPHPTPITRTLSLGTSFLPGPSTPSYGFPTSCNIQSTHFSCV